MFEFLSCVQSAPRPRAPRKLAAATHGGAAAQECVLALCFPFKWEHVYIPVLPEVTTPRAALADVVRGSVGGVWNPLSIASL